MDVKEYLQNPCGTLSIPYWKAKTLAIPDSMRIIHCSNWNGQYGNFQRFFRIKHDLNDLSPIDYEYDTLSIDYQATQLCEMINAVSYTHLDVYKRQATYSEERRRAASEAAKKCGVHRKVAYLYGDKN